MINRKKTVKFTALMLILALLSGFCLSGCGKAPDTVKEGITVDESVRAPYSDETLERARGAILALLSGYFEAENGKAPTEMEKEILSEDAERLLGLTTEILIKEKDYLAYVILLEEKTDELVDALSKLGKDTVETLTDIYFELSDAAGSELVGRVFYGLCLYLYDAKYREFITLYEIHGDDKDKYKYLLIKANEYKADKKIFEECVGAENCSEFIEFAFFFRALFLGGAFEDGKTDIFTDEEILTFVNHVSFSDITIQKDGYKLIAKYYSSLLIAKDTTYFDELLYTACKNGDIDALAGVCGELISLAVSVKENLTANDIALLREGKTKEVTENVFSRFSESDFALFKTVTSVTVSKNSYDGIANLFYPEDYGEFKSNTFAISFDELCESVGEDGFYENLVAYIYGVCPAFAYPLAD